MKSAAALDHLHGFYQPPPPAWTPQTVGWYVVIGLLVLLAAWAGWRFFADWRHNRYRREALRELEHLEISAVPVLLKRTALAAWPRKEVASLSGEHWLQFLSTQGKDRMFTEDLGRRLLDLDYRNSTLNPSEESALRRLASQWIRRHHVRP